MVKSIVGFIFGFVVGMMYAANQLVAVPDGKAARTLTIIKNIWQGVF